MSAAYTPGPWTLNEVDEFDHNDHAATETWVYDSNADRLLARVIGDEKGRCENARLIAAAPELLAALQECVERYARGANCICDWSQDRQGFHEAHCPVFTVATARAAIAKAVQS